MTLPPAVVVRAHLVHNHAAVVVGKAEEGNATVLVPEKRAVVLIKGEALLLATTCFPYLVSLVGKS